jgi:nucleoside-diphosphate-sugar epimerase
MSAPHILLIGGHGKIALQLTPLLLSRSWHVTSLVREASQKDDVLAEGRDQPGRLDVLVSSLTEVKSDQHA